PLWTFMLTALESERMPLPPVQLAPADRATLLAWLHAGAGPAPEGQNCFAVDAGPDVDAALAERDHSAPDTTDPLEAGDEDTGRDADADAAEDAEDPESGPSN